MSASRRVKMAKLQDMGYIAAKCGLPCEAPTTRELERAAWEIGWRAAKREAEVYFSDLSNPVRTLIEAAVHALEAEQKELGHSCARAAAYLATDRDAKHLLRHEWNVLAEIPGGPCFRSFDKGARR